jgi:hypothetical protein
VAERKTDNLTAEDRSGSIGNSVYEVAPDNPTAAPFSPRAADAQASVAFFLFPFLGNLKHLCVNF